MEAKESFVINAIGHGPLWPADLGPIDVAKWLSTIGVRYEVINEGRLKVFVDDWELIKIGGSWFFRNQEKGHYLFNCRPTEIDDEAVEPFLDQLVGWVVCDGSVWYEQGRQRFLVEIEGDGERELLVKWLTYLKLDFEQKTEKQIEVTIFGTSWELFFVAPEWTLSYYPPQKGWVQVLEVYPLEVDGGNLKNWSAPSVFFYFLSFEEYEEALKNS